MRAFKTITDPEAFQLLADDTRRRIIYLLRAREMTVAQIAEELKLTPQAIYHHIRKLKDADMVEVGREERVEHFIETYYRATAEMFNLAHGEATSSEVLAEEVREALRALNKLGIKADVNEDAVKSVTHLLRCMKEPGAASPWTDKVNELEGVSYFAKQELLEFLHLIHTSDKEFEDSMKSYRDLRKALRLIVREPVAAKA